jgi:hypothetical protein
MIFLFLLFSGEIVRGKTSGIKFAPAYDSISSTEYRFYILQDSIPKPIIINCYQKNMIDYTIWPKHSNLSKLWFDICIKEYPNELY